MSRQQDAATTFHQLHDAAAPLILANIWDAGSARLANHLGALAIATTSAGLAWAHGYPDGGSLPVAVLIRATEEIARVTTVPLTVDIEDGLSSDSASVAELVALLIKAGAVGINIEDGLAAPELLASKIGAIKRRVLEVDIDLFINARTDIFLRGLVSETERVEETLRRAAIYQDAGASGLFVPGLSAESEIREIASRTSLPLNVMSVPGLASPELLAGFGVRRLSAGAAISEAVFAHGAALIGGFLQQGGSALVDVPIMGYSDVNHLFADDR